MGHIERIEARGLYGRIDIDLQFRPDVNIIYGTNGSGKTTLLHVIANLLNRDFGKFEHLQFDQITMWVSGQPPLCVSKDADRVTVGVSESDLPAASDATVVQVAVSLSEDKGQYRAWPGLTAMYLPAFRGAVQVLDERTLYRLGLPPSVHWDDEDVILRKRFHQLFGPFTPRFRYPSITGIASALSQQVQRAELELSRRCQVIMQDAFAQVLRTAPTGERSESPDELRREMVELLDKLEASIGAGASGLQDELYRSIRTAVSTRKEDADPGILAIYRDALRDQLQARGKLMSRVRQYFDLVNSLLKGKQLVYERKPRGPVVMVRHDSNKAVTPLTSLSSGEMHLVGLFFQVMLGGGTGEGRGGTVLLIDEPELSLNVDWQALLVSKLAEGSGAGQIIVCTHSPDIGANWPESFLVLQEPE